MAQETVIIEDRTISHSRNFQSVPYSRGQIIPALSITKSGRIGLTKPFLYKHGITKGMRARLYFAAAHRCMALAFIAEADPYAFPITFTTKFGSAYISATSAKPFFEANHLDLQEFAGQYSYDVLSGKDVGLPDVTGEVFVVELGQPATSGPVNATESRAAS